MPIVSVFGKRLNASPEQKSQEVLKKDLIKKQLDRLGGEKRANLDTWHSKYAPADKAIDYAAKKKFDAFDAADRDWSGKYDQSQRDWSTKYDQAQSDWANKYDLAQKSPRDLRVSTEDAIRADREGTLKTIRNDRVSTENLIRAQREQAKEGARSIFNEEEAPFQAAKDSAWVEKGIADSGSNIKYGAAKNSNPRLQIPDEVDVGGIGSSAFLAAQFLIEANKAGEEKAKKYGKLATDDNFSVTVPGMPKQGQTAQDIMDGMQGLSEDQKKQVMLKRKVGLQVPGGSKVDSTPHKTANF